MPKFCAENPCLVRVQFPHILSVLPVGCSRWSVGLWCGGGISLRARDHQRP